MEKRPLGRCGMPCALCPRHYTAGKSCCPGCSSDSFFSQNCKIYECCTGRALNGCWECADYPCERLPRHKDFKGIYSQKIWLRTCDTIRSMGLETFQREYEEKAKQIEQMLARYNNGRLKTFICNLIMNNDLETIKRIVALGESIPYRTPAETGPLFREVVEQLEGVKLGTPQKED